MFDAKKYRVYALVDVVDVKGCGESLPCILLLDIFSNSENYPSAFAT